MTTTNGFRPEVQTKQYVGEAEGNWGVVFQVFTTGDDRFYLFASKADPTFQFPVRKSDLRPGVRRALAHGMSVYRSQPVKEAA